MTFPKWFLWIVISTSCVPRSQCDQMEMSIEYVLKGSYESKTLTLHRGGASSERIDFRNFEKGRSYMVAFSRDGEQFYIPLCGTYYKQLN